MILSGTGFRNSHWMNLLPIFLSQRNWQKKKTGQKYLPEKQLMNTKNSSTSAVNFQMVLRQAKL